jgi:hypothetical protein
MLGSDVDAGVQAVLNDSAREHWTLTNIKQWIYEAELVLGEFAPRALTRTVDITIASGEVTHALDTDYAKLLEVVANMGADGETPGRAISYTALDRLAAVKPKWRIERGPAIRHYMTDERDQRTWYTWPGVASEWHVEARVILAPQIISGLTDTLAADDSYLPAMIDYALHRAYAMDAEEAMNLQLAGAHYGAFASKIGMKIQKWSSAGPGRNSGESPQYPVSEKTGG